MIVYPLYRFRFLLVSVLFLALLAGCDAGFQPHAYFPFSEGSSWTYSGPMGKIAIESGENPAYWRRVHRDSLGEIVWHDHLHKTDSHVIWIQFHSRIPLGPDLEFDPPLLLTPVSDQIGDSRSVTGIEYRSDSTQTSIPIRVEYRIDSIDHVTIPAGEFDHCIKWTLRYSYLEQVEHAYLEGEHTWWLAKDVGPVQYRLPGGQGVLLSAVIGGKKLPRD